MEKLLKCLTDYSYPLFESNQILTSAHLNELRGYLDEGNRASRVKLSGYGIVCGLGVGFSDASKKIVISKGYGVSTEGYFIGLDEESNYIKYKKYVCPEQPLYGPWVSGNKQIDIWQIFTAADTVTGTKSLSQFNASEPGKKLEDMVVLLFLEARERELKSCTGTTCDNKGKKADLTVKALLVKKTDLDQIDLEAIHKQTDLLDEITIERLGARVDLTTITTYNQLSNQYKGIFDSYKTTIGQALIKTLGLYSHILGLREIDPKPFNDLIGMTFNKTLSQYEFDFLKDLILAYEEFKEIACELINACCLEKAELPRHLMLGQVKGNKSTAFEKYRNYFIDSPALPDHEEMMVRSRLLFMRIILMIKGFGTTVSPEREIKITPSREDLYHLGKRSVPYYYSNTDKLVKLWDLDLVVRDKAKYHLSYNEGQYNKSPVVKHVKTPLAYNIDEHSFFRIEGHLGHKFKNVMEELDKMRRLYNLPFDIIALKLSKKTDTVDLDDNCDRKDLESEYLASRDEMIMVFRTLNSRMSEVMLLAEGGEVKTDYGNIVPKTTKERIARVISLLTKCITDFKFGDFYSAYKGLMQELLTFILLLEQVKGHLINVRIYKVSRKYIHRDLQEINRVINYFRNFITSTVHVRLITSYYRYVWKIKELKKNHLSIFSNFAKKYPGMEHQAGVPRGGTFIIVYTDNSASPSSPDIIVNSDFMLPYRVDCCCDIPVCVEEDSSPLLLPPVATYDAIETEEGKSVTIPFIANDLDLNNGKISIKSYDSKSKSNGKVTHEKIENEEVFIYEPPPNFTGIDTFKYQIADAKSKLTDTSVVTVLVRKKYSEHILAVDDITSTDRKKAISIDVMDNDTIYKTTKLKLKSTSTALGGTIRIKKDGSKEYVAYIPKKEGTDSFRYELADPVRKENSSADVTVFVYCCDGGGGGDSGCKFPPVKRDVYLNKPLIIDFYDSTVLLKGVGTQIPEVMVEIKDEKQISVYAVKPFGTHKFEYFGTDSQSGVTCTGWITLKYKETSTPIGSGHVVITDYLGGHYDGVNVMGTTYGITDATSVKNIDASRSFIKYVAREARSNSASFRSGAKNPYILRNFKKAFDGAANELSKTYRIIEANGNTATLEKKRKMNLDLMNRLTGSFLKTLNAEDVDLKANSSTSVYMRGEMKEAMSMLRDGDRDAIFETGEMMAAESTGKDVLRELIMGLLG